MKRKKYSLNENAFSEITKVSSYWAGFIAADGCIRMRRGVARNLCITLHEQDMDRLELLNSFLDSNRPIYTTNKGYKSLDIQNKKIPEDLYKNFNITPRKTFTLEAPNISQEYIPYYIIGLFDGDGCISITTKNYISLSITANLNILNLVAGYFNLILNKNVHPKLYSKNKNGIYSRSWSHSEARTIILYLENYLNDIPYMKRKWDKGLIYSKEYKKFSKTVRNSIRAKELKEEGLKTKEIANLLKYKSTTSILRLLNNDFKCLKN